MEISKPPDNPNMPASVLHTESTILEVRLKLTSDYAHFNLRFAFIREWKILYKDNEILY